MSKYLIFLITLIFISVGCKKSDTSNLSDFCVIADADAITLHNNTNDSYYYVIHREDTHIELAISCSGYKEILSKSTKKISKRDIYGYNNDNQSIVVYYWTCADEKPVSMNNLVLKNSTPYFSICKNE